MRAWLGVRQIIGNSYGKIVYTLVYIMSLTGWWIWIRNVNLGNAETAMGGLAVVGVGRPWPQLHAYIHTEIRHSRSCIVGERRKGMFTPEHHWKSCSVQERGRGGDAACLKKEAVILVLPGKRDFKLINLISCPGKLLTLGMLSISSNQS
jgi:hypothetical protein